MITFGNGPAGTKGPFFVLFTPRSAFLLPCISSQAFPASTPTLSVVNQSPFPLYSADDRPRLLSPPLFADCRRLIHPYAPPSSSTYATSSASATPYPTPTFIIPLLFSYFPRDKTEDVGRSPKSTYRTRRKWLLERRG